MTVQAVRAPRQSIEVGVVYLTPTGRRCRYVPGDAERELAWLTFRYEDGNYRERELVLRPTMAARLLRPLREVR